MFFICLGEINKVEGLQAQYICLQTENENLNTVKADLELRVAELHASELKHLHANESLKEKIKQLNSELAFNSEKLESLL